MKFIQTIYEEFTSNKESFEVIIDGANTDVLIINHNALK